MSDVRKRRRQAAAKYKPAEIDLLLVAEAPPSKVDRYFYFENVSEQDSLFRYVSKMILGRTPDRHEKASALEELRDRGVFLIDLSEDPKDGVDLSACVAGLVDRCIELNASRIILIKANVFDLGYAALNAAGLPVVAERIPFPGSGQQRKFEEAFSRALGT